MSAATEPVRRLAVAVLAIGFMAGCDNSPTGDPAVVTSIEILPASPVLELPGSTIQLTARTLNYKGVPVQPTGTVAWSSMQPELATVDASGVATAVATGFVTITASVDGVEGTAELQVTGADSPGFLNADYTVEATQTLPGGDRQWTGVARAGTVSGGKAQLQRIILEDGDDVREIRTLIGHSAARSTWYVAMADGVTGGFHPLTGYVGGMGQFDTGDRLPDDVVWRLTWSDISVDAYDALVERSTDGGITWEAEWVMRLTRQTVTLPDVPPSPACSDANHHFFDFWVGDWNVHTPDGTPAGTSLEESVAGGCAIQENYSSDVTATSLNMYDAPTGVWWQIYMDSDGNILELSGGPQNTSLVLSGLRGTTQDRFTWTPASDGSVRQRWEVNSGSGWSILFDGIYTPR